MKFSSVVRYIQKTKECRNSFLGILICHEIMFHVSMSYSVCHFLLTTTKLQVTYHIPTQRCFSVLRPPPLTLPALSNSKIAPTTELPAMDSEAYSLLASSASWPW